MAARRGVTGPAVSATSLAWPAGTAVGDLAVLWDAGGWRPPGWASVATGLTIVSSKRLTAADIASAQVTKGAVQALMVFSAAGGIGNVRSSKYCTTLASGVAIWLGWKTPYSSSALADATYQVGSTVVHPTDSYRYAAWSRDTATAGTYEPGSVHDRTNMVSIEIVPLASPLAPTWTAPQSGVAVDRTQSTSVTVAHNSAAAATQDRLRVEIRIAAGTWQHVAANGTIVGTAQELVQSHGLVAIAANQLTANTTYELRAYTHDDGGWSPASASLSLIARTPPTVAVTLTTAAGDLSPTVSWTVTPGLGTQTSWEARIAPAGAGVEAYLPAWATGLQGGSDTSWQAPASIEPTNGGSYVAWLRVTDGALRSAWTASTAQTVSWTAPSAPTSIGAYDGTPPYVRAWGVPAGTLSLEWEQQIDGVWTPLMTTTSPTPTSTAYVPAAPYGVERHYRVRALALVDTVLLASAWRTTTTAMASTDRGAYLVSTDGTEWLSVDIYDDGPRGVRQARTVSYGLGATRPRIDYSPAAGQYGTTSIDVETQTELDALVAWLTTRPQWVMRWLVERDPEGAWKPAPDTTMGLRDELGIDRWDQIAITERNVSFAWVEQ